MKNDLQQRVHRNIDRLRSECQTASEDRWQQDAIMKAYDWAEKLDYPEIESRAARAYEVYNNHSPAWRTEWVPAVIEEYIRECEEGKHGLGFSRYLYVGSFYVGVREYWDEVRRQLLGGKCREVVIEGNYDDECPF
jgi:hypothetical protein